MGSVHYLLIIPSSPALIRELAPAHQPSRQLQEKITETIHELCSAYVEHIELVFPKNNSDYTKLTGSFQAWGASSVNVAAGNYLPELVARYLIGVTYQHRICTVTEHLSYESYGKAQNVLTIVLADGSAGLNAQAPLSDVAGSWQAHQLCQEICSGKLPPYATNMENLSAWLSTRGVVEPQPWVELATFLQSGKVTQASVLAVDDSLGVGRYCALWQCRA
ncbi:hypothetical protein [Corynebacterium sp. sy039]|uniref:hypothetical protein n=1 Tax=Corynebacterium sp. sy039 TaxID=2599641 RepID=UPI0011B6F1F1|nr:hypothetical protein [Corynebacterium sp. sy039]QDZ42766.1 hypothetical protein FQV43_06045 [Corynebacterium sp. sy039]